MRVKVWTAGLVAAALIAACTSSPPATGEEAEIVVSFYPLEFLVERIAGEGVTVANITPPGLEPHDIELTPDQIARIEDADLVVFLGGGFQPALERAIEAADVRSLDVLDALDMGGAEDPHVWLDPVLMQRLVTFMTREGQGPNPLIGHEPDAAFSLAGELEALHARYEAGLGSCRSRLFVPAHDAFGYMAERYDLRYEPITGVSPEAEPDPARLAELSDFVEANDVRTIFTEPLLSPRIAETLARETGARVGVLDPIESLSAKQLDAGEDYLSVMDANLTSLMEGLGCR